MINNTKRNPLRGRIIEYGYTQNDVAEMIGKSKAYCSRRINGYDSFRVSEMNIIGKALEISEDQLLYYFK